MPVQWGAQGQTNKVGFQGADVAEKWILVERRRAYLCDDSNHDYVMCNPPCRLVVCESEANSDSCAVSYVHSPHPRWLRHRVYAVDQLMEEFVMVTAQKPGGWELGARFAMKRPECNYLSRRKQERADAAEYKGVDGAVGEHGGGSYEQLSIEYDEELYPHMLSTIAERSVPGRGKAEAVEELHEKRLLTVPAAQVPGYNQKAYEELVAAMEAMKIVRALPISPS
ncbi:hypothetical protein Tco_1466015 [Tanacetum coccineum]